MDRYGGYADPDDRRKRENAPKDQHRFTITDQARSFSLTTGPFLVTPQTVQRHCLAETGLFCLVWL